MLDLLIVKLAEHALRAIQPLRGAFFIETVFSDNYTIYTFNNRPIAVERRGALIGFRFPPHTKEECHILSANIWRTSYTPDEVTYFTADIVKNYGIIYA
jgi:hypothetical protein